MEGGGRRRPVEIAMRRVEDEDLQGSGWSQVFALQFGDRQIEVTHTRDDRLIERWIQDVHRVHRERVRGGGNPDLVVGLCTFRRKPWSLSKKEEREAAKRDDYPIYRMSLCAGGTHCLVLDIEDGDRYCRRLVPRPLVTFLADWRNMFVGIGVKKAAERLGRASGVHVETTTELRPLVAEAFGRQAVPPFKGGGGDADGLRRMASLALKGVDAGKRPVTVESNDWGSMDSDEKRMHAAVDAFLACEVAEACLDTIKACGSYDARGVL